MISILVSLLRWIVRYQDLIELILLFVAIFLLGFAAGNIWRLYR